MDEKDQKLDEFPVSFGDREIMFNQPTEGQLAVIGKAVWLAKRGGDSTVNGIGLILNVIDKLVVEPNDRNWLEDGLMDGSVKLDDFIAVLDGLNAGVEEEPRPKPKRLANSARSGNGRR